MSKAVEQYKKLHPDYEFIACEHLEKEEFNASLWLPRSVRIGKKKQVLLCPMCSGFLVESILNEFVKTSITGSSTTEAIK